MGVFLLDAHTMAQTKWLRIRVGTTQRVGVHVFVLYAAKFLAQCGKACVASGRRKKSERTNERIERNQYKLEIRHSRETKSLEMCNIEPTI